jgi:nucleotide-binding universal stress UspA family protein
MPGEVILGYDGSPGARAALEEAAKLARSLGTGVVLVFGYAVNPMGGETRDHEMAVRDAGTGALADAVARLRAEGVPVFEEVIHDRADAALLQAAEAYDASYIVVGHHKEGAIRGALLGSVAYALVHRSDRPLLLVPPAVAGASPAARRTGDGAKG